MARTWSRSEEHTSELQSRRDLVCRLLLEKKKKKIILLDKEKKNKNNKQNITHSMFTIFCIFCFFIHIFYFFYFFSYFFFFFFFFNDTATTEIYTLSLHDALPIFNFDGEFNVANRGLIEF